MKTPCRTKGARATLGLVYVKMSESENDTVPLTPESLAAELAEGPPEGVFAWVRPHSPTACALFDAVVDAGIKDPTKYSHIRRFLYLNGTRQERAWSRFSEDEQETHKRGSRQWSDAFKLSLKNLPQDPLKGWYLGTNSDAMDFLLAPSWLLARSSELGLQHIQDCCEACATVLPSRVMSTRPRSSKYRHHHSDTC